MRQLLKGCQSCFFKKRFIIILLIAFELIISSFKTYICFKIENFKPYDAWKMIINGVIIVIGDR